MRASDFILIKVHDEDIHYELARVRPYLNDEKDGGGWDEKRGYYCEGFAQNNTEVYEFSLHLGKTEVNIKRRHVLLGYPLKYTKKQINRMLKEKLT